VSIARPPGRGVTRRVEALDIEPEQRPFEVDSLMLGANAVFVLLFDDDAALGRGLDAIRARLQWGGAPPEVALETF
jgi:hypothetical protein